MHERFHLLSCGLAIVPVFIGAKILLIDIYKIPPKGKAQAAYPFAARHLDENEPRG